MKDISEFPPLQPKPKSPGTFSWRNLLWWGLALGVLSLLGGLALNLLTGVNGEMKLSQGGSGDTFSLPAGSDEEEPKMAQLDFLINLDTLYFLPASSKLQLQVIQSDDPSPDMPGMPVSGTIQRRFDLEPMKIHRVGNSPFYFRLVSYYPDFTFAYQYPFQKDTVPARAPGITVELKTRESREVVTLRADQPGKNRLGDILGLGATFEFYWKVSRDSILSTVPEMDANLTRIVFSGQNRTLYEYSRGEWKTTALREDSLYMLPGGDSLGFTVLSCFPDIAHLRAVPASASSEPVNPVAKVEIWKKGERATEAFLYPETAGKRSGQFAIPGTTYRLALEPDEQAQLKACRCQLSTRDKANNQVNRISLGSKRTGYQAPYAVKLKKCFPAPINGVLVEVSFLPGFYWIVAGGIIISVSLAGMVLFRSRKS